METLRGVAMIVAALVPPAVAVFRHPGRGMRLTERALLAVTLAPFGLALPALACAWFLRLPLDTCLWQSEFIWIVAALWPRARPAPGAPAPAIPPEPIPERGQGFPSIVALSCAVAAAALVGGVALSVPMVRMWSDAWFHAAASLEIARHGVPPQDPNFAGVPLYYPWAFHFMLALLGAAGRVSPFHVMALVNAWAAFVTVLAAAQLAYRAFGRGAAVWAGAIALLGLNPLGWVYWILHGAVGETRGLGTMIANLAGTGGAAISLSHLFPPWHSSMLNRFWTGTALTPALALGVATAWSVARGLERPSRAAWLRTLVLALALYATHPAYAAFAVGAIGLGILASWRAGSPRGMGLLAALALATAAGFVWIRSCGVPGTTTPIHLGLYARNLWALLLAVGPWWLVALPGFIVAARGGPAARFTLAAGASAVAIAAAVVLPEFNSDKLLYLAWLSLAPLAAMGVVAWGDRLRLPAVARLALLSALILPTVGLFTIGVASDRRSPGILVRGDTAAARQLPLATGAEEGAYRFLRERMPASTVVIELPRPTVNEPVPVLAERRVFCGSLDVYLANHFDGGQAKGRDMRALMDEFSVRRGIQHALFTDGTLTEAQSLYLTHFEMPVCLLLRRSEVSDAVWEGFRRRPEWDELIANEQVRLYRFVPGPL